MPFRKLTNLIATAGVSLTVGNYLYALLFAPHDWSKPFEHSFFQAVAVFIVWLLAGINTGFGRQNP